jgi:hypothetical protein
MRDGLALGPGSLLDVREEGDGILLQPVRGEDAVVRRGGVLVFSGKFAGDVVGALRAHRDDRLGRLGRHGRHG